MRKRARMKEHVYEWKPVKSVATYQKRQREREKQARESKSPSQSWKWEKEKYHKKFFLKQHYYLFYISNSLLFIWK